MTSSWSCNLLREKQEGQTRNCIKNAVKTWPVWRQSGGPWNIFSPGSRRHIPKCEIFQTETWSFSANQALCVLEFRWKFPCAFACRLVSLFIWIGIHSTTPKIWHSFNFTFHIIYDVLSINTPKFSEYLLSYDQRCFFEIMPMYNFSIISGYDFSHWIRFFPLDTIFIHWIRFFPLDTIFPLVRKLIYKEKMHLKPNDHRLNKLYHGCFLIWYSPLVDKNYIRKQQWYNIYIHQNLTFRTLVELCSTYSNVMLP